jgi:hypothetical protein
MAVRVPLAAKDVTKVATKEIAKMVDVTWI